MRIVWNLLKNFKISIKTTFSCKILNWSYIAEDNEYEEAKRNLTFLSETNPIFRKHLLDDAEASYIGNRIEEMPNKTTFT